MMLKKKKTGFTLLETLVVAIVISGILAGMIFLLNPMSQITKAKDAERIADLTNLKTVLETYYNDNKAYPTNLIFGSSLSNENTVYSKIIPQDSNLNTPYVYQVDAINSQWVVIYAKLAFSGQTATCQLEKMNKCLPNNYELSDYNYCIVLGNPNCGYIAKSSPPFPTPTPQQSIVSTIVDQVDTLFTKQCKDADGECTVNNSKKRCCGDLVCVPYNNKSGIGKCQLPSK